MGVIAGGLRAAMRPLTKSLSKKGGKGSSKASKGAKGGAGKKTAAAATAGAAGGFWAANGFPGIGSLDDFMGDLAEDFLGDWRILAAIGLLILAFTMN